MASHVPPKDLKDLLLMIETRQQLAIKMTDPVVYKLAPQPFSDSGTMRWVEHHHGVTFTP
jgi:hypothetical protein